MVWFLGQPGPKVCFLCPKHSAPNVLEGPHQCPINSLTKGDSGGVPPLESCRRPRAGASSNVLQFTSSILKMAQAERNNKASWSHEIQPWVWSPNIRRGLLEHGSHTLPPQCSPGQCLVHKGPNKAQGSGILLRGMFSQLAVGNTIGVQYSSTRKELALAPPSCLNQPAVYPPMLKRSTLFPLSETCFI